MARHYKIALIILAVFAADQVFGQGCSQCKLVAEQGADLEEASFGSNINTGILYLMIAPYVLLFIVFHKRIIGFFKAFRKG